MIQTLIYQYQTSRIFRQLPFLCTVALNLPDPPDYNGCQCWHESTKSVSRSLFMLIAKKGHLFFQYHDL